MKIFSPLYDRALHWSRHPHAERYLAGVSFAESSFFPIPPDVLLAPMTLARPERWWRLAALTTVTSVLGGLLGYLIGYVAIEAVTPLLHRVGYWEHFETAHDWFERYGFWAIFAAGFTPIPYKVFTIAAGAAHATCWWRAWCAGVARRSSITSGATSTASAGRRSGCW
jgi:membrane protein YqaA with SNARE-associated domain